MGIQLASGSTVMSLAQLQKLLLILLRQVTVALLDTRETKEEKGSITRTPSVAEFARPGPGSKMPKTLEPLRSAT